MTKATQTCGYSADTEILTRYQGWVTFDRLTYMDEVATRSAEGRFEWQYPERIGWVRYSGEMVHFHGRSMDLLVTPNQRVLWSPDPRTPERGSPASAILERAPRLTRLRASAYLFPTSTWDAPDLAEKVFYGIRRTKMGPRPRDVRMTGDQFAAFMGMYTAEGNVYHAAHDWGISIAQYEGGKGYEEYLSFLTGILGRRPGHGGHQWRICSRPLYEYLQPLGKALSKRLPAEVMDLSRRQLEIFWRYYFLGDGNYEIREGRTTCETAATASRVLAGQLQEIIQKIGFTSSVRRYKIRANAMVRTEGTIYKIRIRRTSHPACNVSGILYEGMTGCARVPNGVVYVRRDGHPAWCGSA